MALRRYGGPEVLEPMDLPVPKVGPDTVLIRSRAIGVNPTDCKIRQGAEDDVLQVHFPLVSGYDVAGVVERVGPAIDDLRPGDEVIACDKQDHTQWGSYAEFVAAPRRVVARRPSSVGWPESAALPLVGLTAYQCLFGALDLRAGETLLVHGASGGVGTVAVQLARIAGAHVIGTASARRHDELRELGAAPVTYGDGLADRVHALCPNGVDAVLDLVGGATLTSSPALLARHGRIATTVDPEGAAKVNARYVFVRPDQDQLARLAGWMDEGRLRVTIGRVLPLSAAAEAQRLQQDGGVPGKIVLTV